MHHHDTDSDRASQPNAPARRQRSNGELNKLSLDDRPAHEWYRFVLSFPPHLVRDYLEKFHIMPGQRVLDPFCGTGTTVVECKKLGIPSVGTEANALAHFASEVKTDWMPDPDELLQASWQVAEEALTELDHQGVEDDPLFRSWSGKERVPLGELRTLEPEREKLLLTDAISPLPLHKVLVLRDCLRRHAEKRYYRHQMLAFAKALTFSISNLHFGPEVGVGSVKEDAPVVATWLEKVQQMASDLRQLAPLKNTPTAIHHADARQILKVIEPHSIDAVITSPPYPNEKDYTRTTRLESVLLGFISTKAELQALKRSLVRSNTRGVYKGDDDDTWVKDNAEIQRIADAIEARRMEMGKTSGFERLYGKVTKLYFGGMARHLAEMRTVLRPGAQLGYVVGDQASYLRIMIRTGQLLAEIAESLGYTVVNIDLFRTRLATATRKQLREEVVILRWPG
ncbi:MAG: DNA methyltransferase [Chloroflexales bacterium]|nr:DNA methyltransferase [Chloroflexales bacterium]